MMNVKMGAKEVSLRKVQKDAENSYRGGFFCCEAVMDAIRNNFEIDVPKEVIGMASAMSIGAGRSGCMCGALNGGILALGMIFGRIRMSISACPIPTSSTTGLRNITERMLSAAVCSQESLTWEKASIRSSASTSPAFVHGRWRRLSVASWESRLRTRKPARRPAAKEQRKVNWG